MTSTTSRTIAIACTDLRLRALRKKNIKRLVDADRELVVGVEDIENF
jgi:hypothetical protein